MALSGGHTGSKTYGFSTRIEWSATQSVANNTSTVTANLYLIIDSGWSVSTSASKNGSITIDTAQTFAKTPGSLSGGKHLLGTQSRTINHNADGTKSVSVSGYFDLNVTISGYGYVGRLSTGSQTYTLDTIPRASQPTLNVSTQALGSSITISTNRASTSFTHTLTYTFGNQSGTIATGVTTSQAWTLPVGLASAIPNATSGVGTITCQTYNGATLIGSKSVSFTATVPNNATFQPTATINSIVQGTTLPSGITVYVQNKSKAKVTSTGSGKYGSTIKTYSVSVAGIGTYTGSVITSDFLRNSGTVRVTLTVTDSRGLKGSTYQDITVVAYSPPQISTFNAKRNESTPTNISISYNASISSVSNQNGVVYRIRSLASGGSWAVNRNVTTGYTSSESFSITSDPDKSYTIEIYVEDKWTSITRTVQVGTAFTLLDFNESGKGMAIGKVSESDSFEVGMPTTIFTTEANILKLKRSSPFANVNLVFENDIQTRYMSFSSEGRPRWNTHSDVNHTNGFDFWTEENSNAMVDSGSNANGSYVRFSDGTQICWLNTTRTNIAITSAYGSLFSGSWTWTFPSSFFASPVVPSPGIRWGTSGSWTTVSAPTNVSVHVSLLDVLSRPAGTNVVINAMAIGRWK